MTKRSYIKEAEQNALNQAKFWTEFAEMVQSMQCGIHNATDRYSPGREKFDQAFDLLRHAAYEEKQHALARCFALVGVGGEEAEKFSREHAKRVFGGNYSTIQWLDPWCRIPSSWHAADEDGLKAELEEAQIGRTETEAEP